MEKKVAIIIPAYKSRFLQQTLDSVAAQTDKDFTVYIGDDASPHDLKNIVYLYQDKLDIVYYRFETNLGIGNDALICLKNLLSGYSLMMI